MDKNALTPVRQKQVTFYHDQIVAVQMEDGTVYVPIRQMCDLLGIGYQGQIDRIRRDPVLQKYEALIELERDEAGSKGGAQSTNCLSLRFVPGWLFGITASRVREEVRDKLILYQEQVYEVIWQAFRDEIEVAPVVSPVEGAPLDDLEAIAQMGLAIYRLARQQRAMEARLENLEDAVWGIDDRTRQEIDQLRSTVSALELRLSPPRSAKITEQQAAELSQAVKLVALGLGKRTGRNEFGAIYGELYRRFGITSYRNLPANAFQEAMKWLEEWFHSIEQSHAPETE